MIKIKSLVMLTAVALVGIVGSIVAVNIGRSAPVAVVASKPVVAAPKALDQDPELVVAMQRLGLDYSKLNLRYNDTVVRDGTSGVFIGDAILISKSVPPNKLDRLISHEYIHYIQSTNPDTAKAFYPYLEGLATNDAWLHNRLKNYYNGSVNVCSDTGCDIAAEAQAYACTEMPDYALSPDFVMFCNKWLPQRYSLFN